MKPAPCPEPLEAAPPIAPGTRLADILDDLTSRMNDVQRHAFRTKMAELDRQRWQLTAVSVTLGSA